MLPPSVIIDIAIAGVLLLCVFMGKKRGLFRSMMGLVVVIAALVIASKAADLGTDFIIEKFLRPGATNAMERRVEEMLGEHVTDVSLLEEIEQVIAAIPNDFIREKADELLQELEVSSAPMSGHSPREVLLEVGEELLDGVLDTAAHSVLHGILYFLTFLAVLLILRLLIGAVDLTLHLPILWQINQCFGLLFGAAEGLVLVYVGVFLLSRLSPWVTSETVEQSVLLKVAVQWLGL